jgi:hypothetical protein
MRAMPELSAASIAIGTRDTAPIGAVRRTVGAIRSLAMTTARRVETNRPSRRNACASRLWRPFGDPTVFQLAAQRRALHDFVFTPSIAISTRTTLSPRAEPTISTVPAARSGAAMVIETADRAEAGDVLRTAAIKDAEITQ